METFGLTNLAGEALGDNNVDRCSSNYEAAYDIGHTTSTSPRESPAVARRQVA